MSDIQQDIERVERMMECALPDGWAAWQRIRARLTPDRERVAEGMFDAEMKFRGFSVSWSRISSTAQAGWLRSADAAIAAMGEP